MTNRLDSILGQALREAVLHDGADLKFQITFGTQEGRDDFLRIFQTECSEKSLFAEDFVDEMPGYGRFKAGGFFSSMQVFCNTVTFYRQNEDLW